MLVFLQRSPVIAWQPLKANQKLSFSSIHSLRNLRIWSSKWHKGKKSQYGNLFLIRKVQLFCWTNLTYLRNYRQKNLAEIGHWLKYSTKEPSLPVPCVAYCSNMIHLPEWSTLPSWVISRIRWASFWDSASLWGKNWLIKSFLFYYFLFGTLNK